MWPMATLGLNPEKATTVNDIVKYHCRVVDNLYKGEVLLWWHVGEKIIAGAGVGEVGASARRLLETGLQRNDDG